MYLTELERFLTGEKADRRARLLIKRLNRKRHMHSECLLEPLPPHKYKVHIALLNAIDATILTIGSIIKEAKKS